MSSALWFLLIISASAVSSEESTEFDQSVLTLEPQSPVFKLADDIYNKQKECESIIGEAVDKVLDDGVYNKLPVPDERYFECKRSLEEAKKRYINTALLGMPYYATIFPMRLSNGKLGILPVPAEEILSKRVDPPEFDVQEELCATNNVCLKASLKEVSKNYAEASSNGLTQRFAHCEVLLEDLKMKYIRVKKLDESELKKKRGLDVKCTEGAITFFLPRLMRNLDYHTTSDSVSSDSSKINPENKNVGEKKSDNEPEESSKSHIDSNNEVVKGLKSITEKLSKDLDISEHYDSRKEIPNRISTAEEVKPAKVDNELMDKPSVSKFIPQEEHVAPNENQNDISKSPEIASNDKTSKVNIKRIDASYEDGPSQKDEKLNNPSKSEDVPKETSNTKIDALKNIPTSDDNQTTINNGNKKLTEEAESSKTKSRERRPPKKKNNESVELVSYRVRVISKKQNGKVVKIQASGTIKKTENGNQPQNPQGIASANLGRKYDDQVGRKTELGLVNALKEGNEVKRRMHPESLEENIIMMENDCQELLQSGEQLMKHKLLSSLINLENHYNECVRDLDNLKKMYIEKHQLDVTSHKNIFPLTLPTGVQKLVSLPTQFLKMAPIEPISSSNMNPGDVFKQGESNRKNEPENATLKIRKPFDDLAFIPNDKFLESLVQGSAPSDSSTLSKVASMLHMNGRHTEKIITE